MKLILKSVLIVAVLAVTGSCKKKKTTSQAQIDNDIITKYISDNKLNAQAASDGLYYVMTTQGTGAQPNINSTVTVSYKGYLVNGNVFDQSASNGISFSLGSVIKGWQEGIPLFKKGGKGMLLIPSALGYGDQPSGSIPANSVLIFDITLLNVQ